MPYEHAGKAVPDTFLKTALEAATKTNPFIGLKATLEASMKATAALGAAYGVPPKAPQYPFGTMLEFRNDSVWSKWNATGMVIGQRADSEYVDVLVIEGYRAGTIQGVSARNWTPIE